MLNISSKKIVLISQHAMIKRGIELMLKWAEHTELVAIAKDKTEALLYCERTQPHVVIVDRIPERASTIKALHLCFPQASIIALIDFDERPIIEHNLIQIGASHTILKNFLVDDLVTLIHSESPAYQYAASAKGTSHEAK